MLKSQTMCGSHCSCALFKIWRSSAQGAFVWWVELSNHTLCKIFASFHNIIKMREALHISSSVGKMLTLQRWERVACEKAQTGDWVFVWWLQDSQGARKTHIYIYIYILIMLSCTLSLSTAMSRMFWQENNEIVSTNLRMEILMIAFSNYHSRLSLRFNSILDINLCYSVPIKH